MGEGDFDFARWSEWLRARGESLAHEGLSTCFKSVDKFGRYMALDVARGDRLGSFCCWEYGAQADYDIMDTRTHSFIVNSWMNHVDNARFAALFEEFLSLVLKKD
jgi:hypothetical protein